MSGVDEGHGASREALGGRGGRVGLVELLSSPASSSMLDDDDPEEADCGRTRGILSMPRPHGSRAFAEPAVVVACPSAAVGLCIPIVACRFGEAGAAMAGAGGKGALACVFESRRKPQLKSADEFPEALEL